MKARLLPAIGPDRRRPPGARLAVQLTGIEAPRFTPGDRAPPAWIGVRRSGKDLDAPKTSLKVRFNRYRAPTIRVRKEFSGAADV